MQITWPLQSLMQAHGGPWYWVSFQTRGCVGKHKYLSYNISPKSRHVCCFTISPKEQIVSQPGVPTLLSPTVFASSFSLLHSTSQKCCLEIFSVGIAHSILLRVQLLLSWCSYINMTGDWRGGPAVTVVCLILKLKGSVWPVLLTMMRN